MPKNCVLHFRVDASLFKFISEASVKFEIPDGVSVFGFRKFRNKAEFVEYVLFVVSTMSENEFRNFAFGERLRLRDLGHGI